MNDEANDIDIDTNKMMIVITGGCAREELIFLDPPIGMIFTDV
jgi:hypothetical protein